MSDGKEKTKVTFIRLPLSYHRRLAELAKKQNRSEGNMASTLVMSSLDVLEERKKIEKG